MPQVKVVIDPEAIRFFSKYRYELLEKKFKAAVEEGFGLAGKNDVAFTALAALYTKNEADIQVEVGYTVGEDEYDQGKPFKPSRKEQETLVELIKLAFDAFCKEQNLPAMSLSAWCMPHHGGYFKMFDK